MKKQLFFLAMCVASLLVGCSPESKLESCVNSTKEELPMYLGEGITLVDMSVQGDSLLWLMQTDDYSTGLTLELLNNEYLNQQFKQSFLDDDELELNDDVKEMLMYAVEANYSLVLRLNCESLGTSTDVLFKPHEIKYMCEE